MVLVQFLLFQILTIVTVGRANHQSFPPFAFAQSRGLKPVETQAVPVPVPVTHIESSASPSASASASASTATEMSSAASSMIFGATTNLPDEESVLLLDRTATDEAERSTTQAPALFSAKKSFIPIPPPNANGITVTSGNNVTKEISKVQVVKTSDLSDDLLAWDAPRYFKRSLPYYHAGHDDDGRPVWIAEMGKYPLKELGELNDEGFQILDKYLKQASLRIIKSIEAQNRTDREVTEAIYILDLDGLDIYQIASSKSVFLLVRIFQAYQNLINNYLGECIIINGNYAAEIVLGIVRPLIGRAMEKVEIYGTNPAKWKNVLRRKIPKNSLPHWYGGAIDFQPIKMYG